MNNEIEKIKWTIKDVIIALTLIFVATFIILFTITIVVFSLKEEIAMSKEVPLIKEIVILFSKLVIASSISLIVWFFSLKKYHCKWNALGFVFKNAKRDILIGALSGVLIFIIVNLVRIPFLHTKAIIAVGEGF
ncbi:MAG: hypothetical protein KKI13_03785, partial [Candidatus Omnitrophica bacterium]|nr:hypothetical protein [Candidatus Omnitrophota bacterium]